MNMHSWIEQISGYIEKIREYKGAIKKAIIDKYKEINPNVGEINPGDDLSEYSSIIREYLIQEFETYFTTIGYKGIPEELLLTLQGQSKFNSSKNKEDLNKVLFVGTNFTGNISNNRRCFLLFTDSLLGFHISNFINLQSLREIYVLEDYTNLKSFKETTIDSYWLFRDSLSLEHIYAILDVSNLGYDLGVTSGTTSRGDYFFSGFLNVGNSTRVAIVPYLKTLYMKNIHRAYNFGNSPLSMDSVLYCINNALYDSEYAINEKTDEKEGTYKFTLKSSEYNDEQKKEMADAVTNRAAALGGNGLNMEIVFA